MASDGKEVPADAYLIENKSRLQELGRPVLVAASAGGKIGFELAAGDDTARGVQAILGRAWDPVREIPIAVCAGDLVYFRVYRLPWAADEAPTVPVPDAPAK